MAHLSRSTLPVVLACATAWAGCGRAEEVAAPRPSVILVSIDTLRADHLSLYGYPRDTAPFLARFAQECMTFERAFTPVAWTLSAHMSLLTGLLPAEHGIEKDDLALSSEVPLVAERLQAAGYQTVALHFPGWIDARRGFARGFDHFRAHRNAEEAGVHLAEALDGLERERPVFLFLHLFDVHSAPFDARNRTIYRAPEPYGELFLTDADAALPATSAKEMWEHGKRLDRDQIETIVAHYDGGIRYVDAQLEQWFTALAAGGWLEDALVIVTADHGEALGQRARKLDGHGGQFQEGVRVPLLVRAPRGARAGERVDTPVHLTDLVPTILDTAGLPADPRLGGHSLLGAVPEARILAGSRADHGYLVAWPRKLVRGAEGRLTEYDLGADPLERRGKPASADDYRRLEEAARGGRGPYPAPVAIGAMSAEDRSLLDALGYGGDE
jgi:arylsulfatase